jgi:hypothetical protein
MQIINFSFQFCADSFQGAGKEIREAISDPSPDVQERAWIVVLPLVEKLKACYEHSLELERIVPKLLGQLVGGRLNPTQHLETQQALVKQLAEILEFVLKFDEYKVRHDLIATLVAPLLIDFCSPDENARDPERLQLLSSNREPPAFGLQQPNAHQYGIGKPHVAVLRPRNAHAESAQRGHIEVCAR